MKQKKQRKQKQNKIKNKKQNKNTHKKTNKTKLAGNHRQNPWRAL